MATQYFSQHVNEYPNQQFPDQWIGHGGLCNWPLQSPDFTPLDFHEKHKTWYLNAK
jgi:hypothetical protein